eukprot:g4506.t1
MSLPSQHGRRDLLSEYPFKEERSGIMKDILQWESDEVESNSSTEAKSIVESSKRTQRRRHRYRHRRSRKRRPHSRFWVRSYSPHRRFRYTHSHRPMSPFFVRGPYEPFLCDSEWDSFPPPFPYPHRASRSRRRRRRQRRRERSLSISDDKENVDTKDEDADNALVSNTARESREIKSVTEKEKKKDMDGSSINSVRKDSSVQFTNVRVSAGDSVTLFPGTILSAAVPAEEAIRVRRAWVKLISEVDDRKKKTPFSSFQKKGGVSAGRLAVMFRSLLHPVVDENKNKTYQDFRKGLNARLVRDTVLRLGLRLPLCSLDAFCILYLTMKTLRKVREKAWMDENDNENKNNESPSRLPKQLKNESIDVQSNTKLGEEKTKEKSVEKELITCVRACADIMGNKEFKTLQSAFYDAVRASTKHVKNNEDETSVRAVAEVSHILDALNRYFQLIGIPDLRRSQLLPFLRRRGLLLCHRKANDYGIRLDGFFRAAMYFRRRAKLLANEWKALEEEPLHFKISSRWGGKSPEPKFQPRKVGLPQKRNKGINSVWASPGVTESRWQQYRKSSNKKKTRRHQNKAVKDFWQSSMTRNSLSDKNILSHSNWSDSTIDRISHSKETEISNSNTIDSDPVENEEDVTSDNDNDILSVCSADRGTRNMSRKFASFVVPELDVPERENRETSFNEKSSEGKKKSKHSRKAKHSSSSEKKNRKSKKIQKSQEIQRARYSPEQPSLSYGCRVKVFSRSAKCWGNGRVVGVDKDGCITVEYRIPTEPGEVLSKKVSRKCADVQRLDSWEEAEYRGRARSSKEKEDEGDSTSSTSTSSSSTSTSYYTSEYSSSEEKIDSDDNENVHQRSVSELRRAFEDFSDDFIVDHIELQCFLVRCGFIDVNDDMEVSKEGKKILSLISSVAKVEEDGHRRFVDVRKVLKKYAKISSQRNQERPKSSYGKNRRQAAKDLKTSKTWSQMKDKKSLKNIVRSSNQVEANFRAKSPEKFTA